MARTRRKAGLRAWLGDVVDRALRGILIKLVLYLIAVLAAVAALFALIVAVYRLILSVFEIFLAPALASLGVAVVLFLLALLLVALARHSVRRHLRRVPPNPIEESAERIAERVGKNPLSSILAAFAIGLAAARNPKIAGELIRGLTRKD